MSLKKCHENNSHHHSKRILEDIKKQKNMSLEVHLTLRVGEALASLFLNRIIYENDP